MKSQHQNYKKEFKKQGYKALSFERVPRTEAERAYFKRLDGILIDLGISCTVEWKKMYKKAYCHHLKIKGVEHTTRLQFDSIDFCKTKSQVIWDVFGDHYRGNMLRGKLNEVQRLKIDLLRMWRDRYFWQQGKKHLENHIIKVLPLKSKGKKAKINEFLRTGSRKFKH